MTEPQPRPIQVMTQPKMALKEAMAQVLADLKAMTPEQLRAELDANRDGDVACAMRELREFAASPEFAEAMSTVNMSEPSRKLIHVVVRQSRSLIFPNQLEQRFDDGSWQIEYQQQPGGDIKVLTDKANDLCKAHGLLSYSIET